MTEKQIKLRSCLLALYLQVPESVAQDVTKIVMDAINELELEASTMRDALESVKLNIPTCNELNKFVTLSIIDLALKKPDTSTST